MMIVNYLKNAKIKKGFYIRKNKVVLIAIFLSFILNINSNLLCEEDFRRTCVAQTNQQEKTFWQANKGKIIAVGGALVLLTAGGIWWLLKKNEDKKNENIFEKNKSAESEMSEKSKENNKSKPNNMEVEPVPQNVKCEDGMDKEFWYVDLDTGRKYSLGEFWDKYIGPKGPNERKSLTGMLNRARNEFLAKENAALAEKAKQSKQKFNEQLLKTTREFVKSVKKDERVKKY